MSRNVCRSCTAERLRLTLCLSRSSEDTDAAIAVAQKAFLKFQHTTPKDRAKVLQKWSDLMSKHQETLAKILMYENGRPIAGARQEISYAAGFLDWFAGEAERSYGYTACGTIPGKRVITIQQPVGVVGVLTPWNFPSAMVTRKVAGAIAAGCTIVLKPAAETPYSALALAELGEQAGVVVTTSDHIQEVGAALTTHKDVRKISFTGSTRVGKLLMAQASSTLKKCSFELGGNAPFIGQIIAAYRSNTAKLTVLHSFQRCKSQEMHDRAACREVSWVGSDMRITQPDIRTIWNSRCFHRRIHKAGQRADKDWFN